MAALTAHADPRALIPGEPDEAGTWVGRAAEAFRERVGMAASRS